jgi:phosphatidate cytidylyltransferase
LSKNLALRLAVAAAGIPALLAMAYYGGYYLLAFGMLLAGLGSHEIVAMAKNKGFSVNHFWTILLPVSCVIAAYIDFSITYVLCVSLMIYCTIVVLKGETSRFFEQLSIYLLPTIYIGLLGAIIIFLGTMYPIGNRLLILTFLVVWAVDTAAYFGGRAWGKKKLAPAISPHKTWAGFYAGFIGALVAAVVSKLIFLHIGWLQVIIMAFLACLFGQIGDLMESGLKRYFGVKDSSTILPGHGGILDRFDSLLFAAPTVYFVAVFWR